MPGHSLWQPIVPPQAPPGAPATTLSAYARTATGVTIALSSTLSRTAAGVTIALSHVGTRTATGVTISLGSFQTRVATGVTIALTGARLARGVTIALQATPTRTAVRVTIALLATPTRTAGPVTISLTKARLATGVTIALAHLPPGSSRTATGVRIALAASRTRTASGVTVSLTRQRRAVGVTIALAATWGRTARNVRIALAHQPGAFANYTALSVEQDTTQVRNEVTAGDPGSAASTGSYTDTFTGNGSTFLWRLTYPVGQGSERIQPTLSVGGVVKALGQAYELVSFAAGASALVLKSDPIPTGSVVLTYPVDLPATARLVDAGSVQDASALPNRGRFATAGGGNSGVTLDAAVTGAQSQLTLFAWPYTKIAVVVPETYTGPAPKPSQQVSFTSHRLGISQSLVVAQMAWVGSLAATGRQLHLTLESPT